MAVSIRFHGSWKGKKGTSKKLHWTALGGKDERSTGNESLTTGVRDRKSEQTVVGMEVAVSVRTEGNLGRVVSETEIRGA